MTELSFNLPEKGEARSSSDAKIREGLSKTKETVNGGLDHSNLSGSAGITNGQLAGELEGSKLKEGTIEAKRFESGLGRIKWYTPKITATEQTRESASFGTLPTADEISSVVMPANGLMLIGFRAQVKSSVENAGKIAIFLGGNQLKTVSLAGNEGQEASTNTAGVFSNVSSAVTGLTAVTQAAVPVTTGQILGTSTAGGFIAVFAAEATYNVTIQYKATSGSVTAKERKLWVAILGV